MTGSSVSHISAAPGGLPLVGHVLPLLRDPLAFLRSLSTQEDLVRLRIGATEAVLVCTPELTWKVLREDRIFDKGGPTFDRAREVLGNGVGSCPYSEHRRQRRAIQPAFHRDRFRYYELAMAKHIDEVVGSWREGQVLDVAAETRKLPRTRRWSRC
ncbi:cytochrome P450 [Nocardia sp. N2S4-5]|uniref:cytochrome P450 n=1 Tax=Nocardia sp. N2S4-5 TaxID=3351565 RepID=UPI0037D68271